MKTDPRIIVNVFHPDLSHSRTNRLWAIAASDAGCLVRDLYQLYPDGNIDIPTEQSLCDSVPDIVFQHPMHWYGAPWLFKKWIDTVLTYGWAYGGADKLAGKRWRQALSVGAGAEEYHATGSRHYTVPEFLRPFERTAGFCRMTYDPFYRFGSGYESEATIELWANEYVQWLKQSEAIPTKEG